MNKNRWVAVALMMCGGIVLILVGGYLLYDRVIKPRHLIPLPEKIANVSLVQRLDGQPAFDEISRLHGKQFPLNYGAVGNYSDHMRATIWVVGAQNSDIAEQMIQDMRDQIESNLSPFQFIGQFIDGDRVVFELVGMGQKHFYFQADELVVWLAADDEIAELALAEVLAYYR